MSCISICHCLGVAMGSLETCTHVIHMPESHNFGPGLYGYVQFSFYLFLIPHLIEACTTFNLGLVFSPTHHKFIHDNNENA